MIIIEKPYVSELLIDTIVQNDWLVLDNEVVKNSNVEEGAIRIVDEETAKTFYSNITNPLVYSNSENAIKWFTANIPDSNFSKLLNMFKDKILYRKTFQELYSDFKYQEVKFEDLTKLKLEDLEFPFVIKPAEGFMGVGVHIINDDKDWRATLPALKEEMERAKAIFTENVINSSRFILEKYIEGEEFAIDAYYNSEGKPVILNIFQHPFVNSKDVKNRIYVTSKGIIANYINRFTNLLKQMGEIIEIRNLAMHMEVRITANGEIIPIEVNPIRFSGWCTTDVAKYAWGINVYEYYFNQLKPDWNQILQKVSNSAYYFSIAEIPDGVDRNKIKTIDYNKFLANYSEVIELRRINPKNNPIFAIIFGKTKDKEEIQKILQIKTKDYITLS